MPRILIFLALVIACPLMYAGVKIIPRTEHYSISGNTPEQLRQQMSSRGPIGSNSRRFDATTFWQIDWNYETNTVFGKCVITDFNIEVNIAYHMPYWSTGSQRSTKLYQKWRTYYDALFAHEKNHAQHGIDAAYEIESYASRLGPRSNCGKLHDLLKTRADKIIKEAKAKDEWYDKITNHGASENVRFP